MRFCYDIYGPVTSEPVFTRKPDEELSDTAFASPFLPAAFEAYIAPSLD